MPALKLPICLPGFENCVRYDYTTLPTPYAAVCAHSTTIEIGSLHGTVVPFALRYISYLRDRTQGFLYFAGPTSVTVAHDYSSRHLDYFYFLPREFTCESRSKTRKCSIRVNPFSRLIRYRVSDRCLDVSIWISSLGVWIRHREGSNREDMSCPNHIHMPALSIRTANCRRRKL